MLFPKRKISYLIRCSFYDSYGFQFPYYQKIMIQLPEELNLQLNTEKFLEYKVNNLNLNNSLPHLHKFKRLKEPNPTPPFLGEYIGGNSSNSLDTIYSQTTTNIVQQIQKEYAFNFDSSSQKLKIDDLKRPLNTTSNSNSLHKEEEEDSPLTLSSSNSGKHIPHFPEAIIEDNREYEENIHKPNPEYSIIEEDITRLNVTNYDPTCLHSISSESQQSDAFASPIPTVNKRRKKTLLKERKNEFKKLQQQRVEKKKKNYSKHQRVKSSMAKMIGELRITYLRLKQFADLRNSKGIEKKDKDIFLTQTINESEPSYKMKNGLNIPISTLFKESMEVQLSRDFVGDIHHSLFTNKEFKEFVNFHKIKKTYIERARQYFQYLIGIIHYSKIEFVDKKFSEILIFFESLKSDIENKFPSFKTFHEFTEALDMLLNNSGLDEKRRKAIFSGISKNKKVINGFSEFLCHPTIKCLLYNPSSTVITYSSEGIYCKNLNPSFKLSSLDILSIVRNLNLN